SEELGVRDVSWINASGAEMQPDDWTQEVRCFGMLMDGRSQTSGIRQRGREATLLMVMNGYHDVVEFTLPPAPDGDGWDLLIDTNHQAEGAANGFDFGHVYQVTARSLLLFLMRKPAVSGVP